MEEQDLVSITLIGTYLGLVMCFWGVVLFMMCVNSTRHRVAAGDIGGVLLGVIVSGVVTSLACGAALCRFIIRPKAQVHDDNSTV